MMLFAVHISDGVLAWPWLAGGLALTGVLLALSLRRIRDEEIPRVALLTAAFFVASQIHVKTGPTSIHLLLNGLIGVVLGKRAALAVFVGLLLQAVLMQHGGFLVLGVNTCVMTVPALVCCVLYRTLHRLPWIKSPTARWLLVGISALLWALSGIYGITLLCNTSLSSLDESAFAIANERLLDPWFLVPALIFAGGVIVVERRLEHAPEFPLGFLIGELSVLLTAALNCAVLILGGEQNWPIAPLLLVIAHLPFAVVEGVVLGFLVGFLAKVKPELLGAIEGSSA